MRGEERREKKWDKVAMVGRGALTKCVGLVREQRESRRYKDGRAITGGDIRACDGPNAVW